MTPTPLMPCKEPLVKVNRFRLIRIQGNVYSLPSRLIGAKLRVWIPAEELEVYRGATPALRLARLVGP